MSLFMFDFAKYYQLLKLEAIVLQFSITILFRGKIVITDSMFSCEQITYESKLSKLCMKERKIERKQKSIKTTYL